MRFKSISRTSGAYLMIILNFRCVNPSPPLVRLTYLHFADYLDCTICRVGILDRLALSPLSVISDIGLSLLSERPISD
jgi:hypothetical protein